MELETTDAFLSYLQEKFEKRITNLWTGLLEKLLSGTVEKSDLETLEVDCLKLIEKAITTYKESTAILIDVGLSDSEAISLYQKETRSALLLTFKTVNGFISAFRTNACKERQAA
jgi:hypothetical protein